jgi:hypothetical protein
LNTDNNPENNNRFGFFDNDRKIIEDAYNEVVKSVWTFYGKFFEFWFRQWYLMYSRDEANKRYKKSFG